MSDRKVFRIIRYTNGTVEWRQIGFIGDNPDELELGFFSDADYAGDRDSMRSTPGVFRARVRHSQLLPAKWAKQEANGCIPQYR